MQIRNSIYAFGIALLIIGLPFSRAFISIAELILIVNWLSTKDVLKNFKNFFRNKQAFWFSAIYLMHLIGILYTTDMSHGFQEIKTKVPILLLPLVFVSSRPLSKTHMRFFLLLFSSAVTASIGTSLVLYYTQNIVHFRDAFPFVSHIRLSLMVVISMSILYYYIVFEPIRIRGIQVLMIALLLFNMSALFLLELLSGAVILIILIFATLFYHALFRRKHLIAFLSSFIIIISALLFLFFDSYNSYFPDTKPELESLPKTTEYGNPYEHTYQNFGYENGKYIGHYICWDELEEDWKIKSSVDFLGKDDSQQEIRFTLIRYLNSKHLTKDRNGLEQLSSKDIGHIEKGIANEEYVKKWSIRKRLYKIFWEYSVHQQGKDVSGHSVIQRIELWKVAGDIISSNWLVGIGTGDIPSTFKAMLKANQAGENIQHLRTHNQYFSIILAFGIIGFVFFIFCLLYPAIILKGFSNYLFLSFFLILSLSMLWEDTLETQVGVTLFAFFYSFYLFAPSSRDRSLRRSS